jgi:hypothetical protein
VTQYDHYQLLSDPSSMNTLFCSLLMSVMLNLLYNIIAAFFIHVNSVFISFVHLVLLPAFNYFSLSFASCIWFPSCIWVYIFIFPFLMWAPSYQGVQLNTNYQICTVAVCLPCLYQLFHFSFELVQLLIPDGFLICLTKISLFNQYKDFHPILLSAEPKTFNLWKKEYFSS